MALDGIAIKPMQPSCVDVSGACKYYNRKNMVTFCVQVAVTSDYCFVFVLPYHAGSTEESTAFQASGMHRFLTFRVLPRWAVVVADDAYFNENLVVTPWSGSRLDLAKYPFNFYQSSCLIPTEPVFRMLINLFSIFWSPMKISLGTSSTIIGVACKLHNFIIDTDEDDVHEPIPGTKRTT